MRILLLLRLDSPLIQERIRENPHILKLLAKVMFDFTKATHNNFWHTLPKPLFVQAPMEDVTDAAFRALIARYSSPDIPRVMFTEFTSADGLVLAPEEGKEKLLKKLL